MKIALTYTGTEFKHLYYVDWLMGKDKIEILKISADNDNLHQINNADALVIPGGRDIHPKFYGAALEYPGTPGEFDEQRDQFEMDAFYLAQQNQLPVLGICRGMQLINVIHNGTLIQDIPSEKLYNDHGEKNHSMTITPGSLLHKLTGETSGSINSLHHQAIGKLGEGLMINAVAEDGIIEGFEWEDKNEKPFMLAVQWHPERMFQEPQSPFNKKLRDQFISEIKK